MGLVQKIFYFHVPSAMVMFIVGVRVRHRERRSTCSAARRRADRLAVAAAELTVLFGLIVLVTGPALGAQGVGRVVAVGRAADVGAAARG